MVFFFFFQAEDGIRDLYVTGVQTCALPISAQSAGKTPLENVASRVQSGAGCGCSGLGRSYREREHRPQWRARTPARGDGSGRKDTQKLKQIPGPRPAVSQSSSRARLAEPTSGPARRN